MWQRARVSNYLQLFAFRIGFIKSEYHITLTLEFQVIAKNGKFQEPPYISVSINNIFAAAALVPHQLEKVRNLILILLGLRNLTGQLINEAASSPDSFTLKSQLCYSMPENQLIVSVLNKSYK